MNFSTDQTPLLYREMKFPFIYNHQPILSYGLFLKNRVELFGWFDSKGKWSSACTRGWRGVMHPPPSLPLLLISCECSTPLSLGNRMLLVTVKKNIFQILMISFQKLSTAEKCQTVKKEIWSWVKIFLFNQFLSQGGVSFWDSVRVGRAGGWWWLITIILPPFTLEFP